MAHRSQPLVAPLVLLAALLLSASTGECAPTPAQFRAELKSLRSAVSRKMEYSAFTRAIDSMLAYPNSMLPQMYNTTILVPKNKALYKLGIRTLQNTTAMTLIGRFNVLASMATAEQLAKVAIKKNVVTMLNGQPLQRYASPAAAKGQATLGPTGVAASGTGFVTIPNMYRGKFLRAHGFSAFFKPKNVK